MLRDIRPTGASAWDQVAAIDTLFHLDLYVKLWQLLVPPGRFRRHW